MSGNQTKSMWNYMEYFSGYMDTEKDDLNFNHWCIYYLNWVAEDTDSSRFIEQGIMSPVYQMHSNTWS